MVHLDVQIRATKKPPGREVFCTLCFSRLGRDPPNRYRLLKNQELDHNQNHNSDQENGLHSIPSPFRLAGTSTVP
jgi:hypothetical protein